MGNMGNQAGSHGAGGDMGLAPKVSSPVMGEPRRSKATLRRVVFFDVVLTALALPVVLDPSARLTPLLLAVPAAWALRRRVESLFVDRTPLNLPVALLALMALVSLYATYSIRQSLPKIAGLVFGIGVFFTVAHYASSAKAWHRAAGLFLLMGAAVAALGLLGSNWLRKVPALVAVTERLPSVKFALHGAQSGFHPNEVAGVLLWIAPASLVAALLALLPRGVIAPRAGRPLAITLTAAAVGVAALIWGTLVLTQSRSGWIGAVAALVFMGAVVVNRWLPIRPPWRALIWGLLGLAALAAMVAFAPRLLEAAGSDPSLEATSGSALSVDTLEGRVETWSRAIYGLQDFPFTGMGMNTFRQVVHVLYPLFTVSPEVDIAHAHNHLLQAGLDLGLPGLIAYLSLWLGAAVMLRQVWHRHDDLEARIWALGLGGGLMGHFVYGLTDAVALGAKPGVLWWMLLGLIASLYRVPSLRPARAEAQPGPARAPTLSHDRSTLGWHRITHLTAWLHQASKRHRRFLTPS